MGSGEDRICLGGQGGVVQATGDIDNQVAIGQVVGAGRGDVADAINRPAAHVGGFLDGKLRIVGTKLTAGSRDANDNLRVLAACILAQHQIAKQGHLAVGYWVAVAVNRRNMAVARARVHPLAVSVVAGVVDAPLVRVVGIGIAIDVPVARNGGIDKGLAGGYQQAVVATAPCQLEIGAVTLALTFHPH